MCTLEPHEVYLTVDECARWLGRSRQALSRYRSKKDERGNVTQGLLRCRVRGRVRLDDFQKFTARVFPTLARLDTVAQLDAWRESQRTGRAIK